MIELQINFHDFIKAADAIGGPMNIEIGPCGVYFVGLGKRALVPQIIGSVNSDAQYAGQLCSKNKIERLLLQIVKVRSKLKDSPDILTIKIFFTEVHFTFGRVIAARCDIHYLSMEDL
jgi:hypothetical protein